MPQVPTDLPNLQSWISSSTPYHNVNHAQASFIDVNDFTVYELEVALRYAIQVYQDKQTELGAAIDRGKSHASQATIATKVLEWATSGPIAEIPTQEFQQMVMAAKFADDLTYQNCVVGLAVGIRRLKDEIVKLEQQDKATAGDEDDWFLVGKDEAEQREQDRLYAEIEIQLDGALARGTEQAEEGDIEVMFAGR
ncbi:hypothetical protein M409DRAFT_30901 [Zasmidium cellare ATCC 36951]|uniref:Uncharacterized protein n=1 Tax=Zasmidium cellare ATCC 36951 TaxID=1080233 RepID=A0A6A6BV47_ZASCE|nr:uncharacterized protein M409DRAFT_30901 [Zasmidium cellare ATCC 36951]KAF2158621.1 hypothetical protein M409DRAFT_30901 [Zasmidium cellare ATCC 36951]